MTSVEVDEHASHPETLTYVGRATSARLDRLFGRDDRLRATHGITLGAPIVVRASEATQALAAR